MPRKAKDKENEIDENTIVSKKRDTARRAPTSVSKSGAVATKTTTKKKDTVKKETPAKKTAEKKSAPKKSSVKETTTKKATTKKVATKETSSKKTTTKKATVKKTATKKSTTQKKSSLEAEKNSKTTPTKKTTTKKKSTTRRAPTKKNKIEENLEYYDLPYRYNETTVKILAQTPKKLFIYWDISDDDRKNYIENFGTDFFNNTVPVLIIHNDSKNYTFEIEINDFANCWYLDINDTKCKYTIELGRRSKLKNYSIPNNYIYVTSSNVIESPNDHILFEKQAKTVYFRNVKTNATHSKDIANISFIRNMGKIYNIYDAYKKLYGKMYSDEDIIDINNPSSNNPTSTFK